MAGEEGIEPSNAASKGRCLTTWRLPNVWVIFLQRTKCKKKARESQIGCVDFPRSNFKKGPALARPFFVFCNELLFIFYRSEYLATEEVELSYCKADEVDIYFRTCWSDGWRYFFFWDYHRRYYFRC